MAEIQDQGQSRNFERCLKKNFIKIPKLKFTKKRQSTASNTGVLVKL